VTVIGVVVPGWTSCGETSVMLGTCPGLFTGRRARGRERARVVQRDTHLAAPDVRDRADRDRGAALEVVDRGGVRLGHLVRRVEDVDAGAGTTSERFTPCTTSVNVVPRLPNGGRTAPMNGVPVGITRKVASDDPEPSSR
jgi:hypothetical protein